MLKKLLLITLLSSLFVGCASVPTVSNNVSTEIKRFTALSKGNAGLYVYRAGGPGTALKKDIRVDGKCIGESAPNMFFYEEVTGGKEHKISTESEFSPNDLSIKTETGKNYFVEQYIKMGIFVGGANLRLVDEKEGKKAIAGLEMGVKGTCGK